MNYHDLVDVFPTLCGGEPSAQRANDALILTAIKSTHLVALANANLKVSSQRHPTTPPMTGLITTHTRSPLAIPNQLPSYTHVDHLVI